MKYSKRNIYTLTTIAGRSERHAIVTSWNGKIDLLCEVDRECSEYVPNSATIAELCDRLDDKGPGFGARCHMQISHRDAIAAIRRGAKSIDCLNLPKSCWDRRYG